MKNYEIMNFRNQFPSSIWNEPFLPTDKLFDSIFSKAFPDFSKTFGIDAIQKASYPKVNIIETDSEIKFVAEIAGLTKDEVQVSIKDNEDNTKTLAISGKKEADKKEEEKKNRKNNYNKEKKIPQKGVQEVREVGER